VAPFFFFLYYSMVIIMQQTVDYLYKFNKPLLDQMFKGKSYETKNFLNKEGEPTIYHIIK